jgi:hypothetical protein
MSERPLANPASMHLVAPRMWRYESEHAVKFIMMAGYFDPLVKNLRPEDEIALISFGELPVRHLLLVVDDIRADQLDKVKVSTLHEWKRKGVKQ